jgi:hypothetical protein
MMPIRRSVWYSVDGYETRYELATVFSDGRDVATDAAKDYHGNRDGWESHWPVEISLYESEEGPEVARFEVERETVPQFHATELTLEPTPDAPKEAR